MVDTVSTDSRTIRDGQLFVALRGDNFDAHKFVEDVTRSGAAGAIVERNWKGNVPNQFGLLRADDTLVAYQQLAANYRKSLPLKVLAITGSNGKTSTKDFAAAVLGEKIPRHQDGGQFQQPRRSSSNNSGGNIRG